MMREAMRSAYAWRMMRPALRGLNAERYARTDGRTDEELNYNSVDQLSLRTAHAHTAILSGLGCRAVLAPLAGRAA